MLIVFQPCGLTYSFFSRIQRVRVVAHAGPLGTLRYRNQHCCAVGVGGVLASMLAHRGLSRASARPLFHIVVMHLYKAMKSGHSSPSLAVSVLAHEEKFFSSLKPCRSAWRARCWRARMSLFSLTGMEGGVLIVSPSLAVTILLLLCAC